MTSQTGDTEADDEAIFLLGKVQQHSFTASPTEVGPFGSSRLSWSVTAPEGVTIRLDGLTVAVSGERWLQPTASETHWLSAKAGRHSKSLGAVSVHVNFAQCPPALETTFLPNFVADAIQRQIDADNSGIYFRLVPVLAWPTGITYVRSKPLVWISPDRLNIALQLGQKVDTFPDASIDLSVSFGLQVVPDQLTIIGTRRIVATAEVINVDISFPFYAWLIPGAMVGLPIAIDHGKEKARARVLKMINEIVGQTGPGYDSVKSLNTFFYPPPGTEKHHVQLYLDSYGDGIFAVRYCPDSGPPVIA